MPILWRRVCHQCERLTTLGTPDASPFTSMSRTRQASGSWGKELGIDPKTVANVSGGLVAPRRFAEQSASPHREHEGHLRSVTSDPAGHRGHMRSILTTRGIGEE